MSNDLPAFVQELNDWFSASAAARNGTSTSSGAYKPSPYKRMLNDEEMYFGDVEGTGTQLTDKQLRAIQEKYDIPISTKLSYAICEQVASFLTGGKPYPRLLATSATTKEWSQLWEQIFAAWWYEADMNTVMREATIRYVGVGQGWVEVRQDNFYSETTFGVTAEYIPWQKVYVDPTCSKRDLSDAEIVCICEPMIRTKAEKFFGITLKDDDDEMSADWLGITNDSRSIDDPHNLVGIYQTSAEKKKSKFKKYWVRRFYEQINTIIYTDENGNVGIKPPKPIEIPNPEKAALFTQMEALKQQGQGLVKNLEAGAAASQGMETELEQGADPSVVMPQQAQQDEADAGTEEQAMAMGQQYQAMQQQWAAMPDMVDAYRLTTIEGRTVTAREISKRRDKRIRKTVMLGNKVMQRETMSVDVYPIVPVTMNFYSSFNRTFGLMHYIKDMQKALNRLWSQMIYEMQLSSGRRFLYPDGSIVDPTQVEKDMAKPGSWIKYDPNPALEGGGKPESIDGAPLSPAIKEMISLLVAMIEQTTGIGQLQQGQVSSATPDSFGGIQTMQTFGTQRVKLYARDIEDFLERLTYVTVQMLQKYMPRDVPVQYFDDNGDQKEVQVLEDQEDMQFKVRVNITSNLPTARAMTSQILGIVSGQTKNPYVADLLTKEVLKQLDLPDAEKIAEQIDTVKMMGQQIEQLQTEMQNKEKELSQIKQQVMQKDIEAAQSKAVMEIEAAKDLKIQAIEMADDARELAFQGGNVGNDAARVTADDNIT